MTLLATRSGDAIANALMASTGIDNEIDEDAKDLFRANMRIFMGEVNTELTGHLKVDTVVGTNVPGTGLTAGATPVTGNATGSGSGQADPEGAVGGVS